MTTRDRAALHENVARAVRSLLDAHRLIDRTARRHRSALERSIKHVQRTQTFLKFTPDH